MFVVVLLAFMSGYTAGYSVVTDKNTLVKIPLPADDLWSRILVATTHNDTRADITFHVEGYELLSESASPVEAGVWHVCDVVQPNGEAEGYVVAPLFRISHKFTQRIIHVSLVSNASATWVLCTDSYTCGVATGTSNIALIVICVFLALLSSVLALYICWAKHREGKTCQTPHLEKTATTPPAEGKANPQGPDRVEPPAQASRQNSEHDSENSLYNVITK
ncbi:hypothetical protein C7M84_009854 [Penaeus vannamei]|uniref:Uncharacterized protein n=1 Tax=Penaeus vannamei TaxID=6689 RepID=A0A423T5M9_PENVA|nr:hypothetical protein C7M84_009854 [Penaeus vannamei]